MYIQFAIATVMIGSLFSMSTFAACQDDEKRRNSSQAVQPLENIVDIHNSPVILEHPTRMQSGAEGGAELEKLRKAGEMREIDRRTWYQSRGKAYPERFAGD
ncbi:MAG: hypothetical protein WC208_04535 [Gallionella sp.]|jgi:GTPase